MFLRTGIGLIASACLSTTAVADGARYFAINASRVPDAGLPPDATVSAEDNPVAAAIARVSTGSATIDLGFDWQYTRYEYEGIDSRNRDLHRVQFPVWIDAPGNDWQFKGVVAPGIFTSSNVLGDFFNRGSSDDLFVAARVEVRREIGIPWVAGVTHDRLFGRSLTYPVVGVQIDGEAIDLRLTWPDPAVRFQLADRHKGSFRLFPAGNQWHVRTDDFAEEFDYRFEAWRSQLDWSAGPYGGFRFDVSLGYEFARSHYFTDDVGDRIGRDADDQWLFAVGLRLGDAPLPLAHGEHLYR